MIRLILIMLFGALAASVAYADQESQNAEPMISRRTP